MIDRHLCVDDSYDTSMISVPPGFTVSGVSNLLHVPNNIESRARSQSCTKTASAIIECPTQLWNWCQIASARLWAVPLLYRISHLWSTKRFSSYILLRRKICMPSSSLGKPDHLQIPRPSRPVCSSSISYRKPCISACIKNPLSLLESRHFCTIITVVDVSAQIASSVCRSASWLRIRCPTVVHTGWPNSRIVHLRAIKYE